MQLCVSLDASQQPVVAHRPSTPALVEPVVPPSAEELERTADEDDRDQPVELDRANRVGPLEGIGVHQPSSRPTRVTISDARSLPSTRYPNGCGICSCDQR